MSRIAVVLYNLGGPDGPEAVRPFLRNLFADPMIIRAPGPVRFLLAELISRRRAPVARGIYAQIGGKSPILEETEAQASALAARLAGGTHEFRTFVAMRYWHPFADEVARKAGAWGPDKVVLLPLYPQFSTTTTGSFLRIWRRAAADAGLDCPSIEICCWPELDGFVSAVAGLTAKALSEVPGDMPVRVLFSAHGLPRKIVEAGDPYAMQVERTVAAIVDRLGRPPFGIEGLDRVVCYQSRVGPLEWLKPYTDDQIRRAGADGRALVVVPVAFVSEHSETLVELDIEYAHLAAESGVPLYLRVPTAGVTDVFVGALAELVSATLAAAPAGGTLPAGRSCGAGHGDCPCLAAEVRPAA